VPDRALLELLGFDCQLALNTHPVVERNMPPAAQKVDALLALTRRSILLDIRILQDLFEEDLALPLEDSRVGGLGNLC
jgi:hypothetical protein